MAQQMQSKMGSMKPASIAGPKVGIKRAPAVTAKSLKGEMKVNKVFGTDLKPKKTLSKKLPTMSAVKRSVKKTMGY